MSAVSIAVRAFRRLESEDFRLLEAIEQQMKNYEFAPIDAIQNQSGLSMSEIEYRIPNLTKRRILRGWREKQYVSLN